MRNKFNKVTWPKYEQVHQKYLSISKYIRFTQAQCPLLYFMTSIDCFLLLREGSKPRIKDHYRAHKLSMWLNLVPQLVKMPVSVADDHPWVDDMYRPRHHMAPWLRRTTPTKHPSTTAMASSPSRTSPLLNNYGVTATSAHGDNGNMHRKGLTENKREESLLQRGCYFQISEVSWPGIYCQMLQFVRNEENAYEPPEIE